MSELVVLTRPAVLAYICVCVFQTLVVAVLVAGALADMKPVGIVHIEQHHPDANGAHSFDFEAENGIKMHVSGNLGENGGENSIGHWR